MGHDGASCATKRQDAPGLCALPFVKAPDREFAEPAGDVDWHGNAGVLVALESEQHKPIPNFGNRRSIRKNRPHATISNRLNEWSGYDLTFRAFANNNTRLTDGNHVHPVTAA